MPTMFTKIHVPSSADFGTGGVPFSCHAPSPGLALVGLDVRVGDWIDQVTPIFAELYDDGSLGPQLRGSSCGGWGGGERGLRVPMGHVVVGLQTRSADFVDAVRLLHARWDGAAPVLSESGWTAWMGGNGGIERPERLAEPVGGAMAVGIAGRAGAYVDCLTLVSAELVRLPAHVSPTVSSGRGTRSTHAS